MKKETVREYTILYQYLLQLKEPTYVFLIQVFQHISPITWWEDFIEPIIEQENKENFKYLDMADLLNVFKINWEKIFKYLDKNYFKYKYDKEYRLVSRVHQIRRIVAHANENEMNPFIFADSLLYLLSYSKLVNAPDALVRKLGKEYKECKDGLPEKKVKISNEEKIRNKIITIIENEVLLKAKSCENLPPDIRLSVDRTAMRINSMRTVDEIVGFFNNAIVSERGVIVQAALYKENLLTFESIKEQINQIYQDGN